MKKNIFKSKKLKYGGFATALTLIFLAAVIIVNVISTALVERYPLKIDLTGDKMYALSEVTENFVKGVDKEVTIDILTTEQTFRGSGQYFVQADEMIKMYAKLNDKITLNYVDIVKNPAFTSKFKDQTVKQYDIVITSGDRIKVIDPSQLFNVDTSNQSVSIASSKVEQVMTSAVMGVTSDENYKVAFVNGHGEMSSAGFESVLSQNIFDISSISLGTQDIPEDVSCVMIVAPSRDFSEAELKKLDAFLDNNGKLGKSVFYVGDPEQPNNLTNLDAFLAEWGIKVGEGTVYETNPSNVYNYQRYFVKTEYADTDFAGSLAQEKRAVALPASRPLEMLFTSGNGKNVKSLLQFSKTAGVAPVDAGESFDYDGNVKGSAIPGVVLSTQTTYAGTTLQTSNVVAAGSISFISSDLIQNTSVANGEYLINLINTLTERKNVVDIVPKTIGGTSLSMTQNQVNLLTVTFMAIVPIVVLICGIVIWLRRRNR